MTQSDDKKLFEIYSNHLLNHVNNHRQVVTIDCFITAIERKNDVKLLSHLSGAKTVDIMVKIH